MGSIDIIDSTDSTDSTDSIDSIDSIGSRDSTESIESIQSIEARDSANIRNTLQKSPNFDQKSPDFNQKKTNVDQFIDWGKIRNILPEELISIESNQLKSIIVVVPDSFTLDIDINNNNFSYINSLI